jgi:hypothetical protein
MSDDAVELPFDRALLERQRPAVHYDPQDAYRAVSARSTTDNPGNLLALRDGSVLARAGATLSLELLSNYPPHRKPDERDRLDQSPDRVAAARRFQADPAYANRAYGRIAQHGAHTWLQYWFWFYYNPKNVLGFGKHEGDWELVQIGLTEDREPGLVTCSQHTGGQGRNWSAVRTQVFDDGEHLVVCTAPFSHAMYFEAGAHPYLGGIDNPDDTFPALMPEIEELGAWRSWPGRWGNSKGVLAQLGVGKLGGESPRSPAHQGARWDKPTDYHAGGKSSAATAISRTARVAGKLTYPRLTSLNARLAGQELILDYGLESRPLAGAGLLYVTVHDDTAAPGAILLSTTIEIDERVGATSIHLPESVVRCVVYASAFNRLRQRSDFLAAIATQPA